MFIESFTQRLGSLMNAIELVVEVVAAVRGTHLVGRFGPGRREHPSVAARRVHRLDDPLAVRRLHAVEPQPALRGNGRGVEHDVAHPRPRASRRLPG